jgi:hypothetical protein
MINPPLEIKDGWAQDPPLEMVFLGVW